MKSSPCDFCHNDPVRRSGKRRKGMYVCGTCRGLDRFLRLRECGLDHTGPCPAEGGADLLEDLRQSLEHTFS